MEILKGHSGIVRFTVPTDLTSATFKVFRGEAQIGNNATATIAAGVATATLPYAAVVEDGNISVELRFIYQGSPYTQTKTATIVTPLLETWEISEFLGNTTPQETREVESATRHIINAHCGQTFGKFVGTHRVFGRDGNALELPQRLISITDINGQNVADYYEIIADGFYLKYYNFGVPPVKADYWGLHQHVGGVIHNPNNVKIGRFSAGNALDINGIWGYESVPEPVREAAKLLINDYADADSEYRDRYLTSMTAADWRIQFNSGAFARTGNVRADQLLSDYILKRGWVVI
jgi:hypothetical protein